MKSSCLSVSRLHFFNTSSQLGSTSVSPPFAVAWKLSPGCKLGQSWVHPVLFFPSLRDHCPLFSDNQGLKTTVSCILTTSFGYFKQEGPSGPCYSSWLKAEVSFSFLSSFPLLIAYRLPKCPSFLQQSICQVPGLCLYYPG